MKKFLKYLPGSALGAAYAALSVALSRWLLTHLAELFEVVGGWAALDSSTLSYGSKVLAQLKTASIDSPWIPFLLGGALLGTGFSALLMHLLKNHRATRITINLSFMILFLLPLALAALWFTPVNDIRIGALINTLLPLISHLL